MILERPFHGVTFDASDPNYMFNLPAITQRANRLNESRNLLRFSGPVKFGGTKDKRYRAFAKDMSTYVGKGPTIKDNTFAATTEPSWDMIGGVLNLPGHNMNPGGAPSFDAEELRQKNKTHTFSTPNTEKLFRDMVRKLVARVPSHYEKAVTFPTNSSSGGLWYLKSTPKKEAYAKIFRNGAIVRSALQRHDVPVLMKYKTMQIMNLGMRNNQMDKMKKDSLGHWKLNKDRPGMSLCNISRYMKGESVSPVVANRDTEYPGFVSMRTRVVYGTGAAWLSALTKPVVAAFYEEFADSLNRMTAPDLNSVLKLKPWVRTYDSTAFDSTPRYDMVKAVIDAMPFPENVKTLILQSLNAPMFLTETEDGKSGGMWLGDLSKAPETDGSGYINYPSGFVLNSIVASIISIFNVTYSRYVEGFTLDTPAEQLDYILSPSKPGPFLIVRSDDIGVFYDTLKETEVLKGAVILLELQKPADIVGLRLYYNPKHPEANSVNGTYFGGKAMSRIINHMLHERPIDRRPSYAAWLAAGGSHRAMFTPNLQEVEDVYRYYTSKHYGYTIDELMAMSGENWQMKVFAETEADNRVIVDPSTIHYAVDEEDVSDAVSKAYFSTLSFDSLAEFRKQFGFDY